MKKTMLFLIIFQVLIPAAQAKLNRIPTDAIKEVGLFDGRVINAKKSIDKIYFYDRKIDYFELKSGEIIDHREIKSMKLSPNDGLYLAGKGVDGGG